MLNKDIENDISQVEENLSSDGNTESSNLDSDAEDLDNESAGTSQDDSSKENIGGGDGACQLW